MPRQAEYDIQATLETGISKVESKVQAQGIYSHADSDVQADVSDVVTAIESKVLPLSGTQSGISVVVEAIESKIEVQGVVSLATSAVQDAMSNVQDSMVDDITSVIADVSDVEAKLDVLGAPFQTTFFMEQSGAAVALSEADSWAEIWGKSACESKTAIKAIKITDTGTPSVCAYRITDGTTKLFPYGESKAYVSGEENVLVELVQAQKGESLIIEVKCSAVDGASAALTSLKKIQFD